MPGSSKNKDSSSSNQQQAGASLLQAFLNALTNKNFTTTLCIEALQALANQVPPTKLISLSFQALSESVHIHDFNPFMLKNLVSLLEAKELNFEAKDDISKIIKSLGELGLHCNLPIDKNLFTTFIIKFNEHLSDHKLMVNVLNGLEKLKNKGIYNLSSELLEQLLSKFSEDTKVYYRRLFKSTSLHKAIAESSTPTITAEPPHAYFDYLKIVMQSVDLGTPAKKLKAMSAHRTILNKDPGNIIAYSFMMLPIYKKKNEDGTKEFVKLIPELVLNELIILLASSLDILSSEDLVRIISKLGKLAKSGYKLSFPEKLFDQIFHRLKSGSISLESITNCMQAIRVLVSGENQLNIDSHLLNEFLSLILTRKSEFRPDNYIEILECINYLEDKGLLLTNNQLIDSMCRVLKACGPISSQKANEFTHLFNPRSAVSNFIQSALNFIMNAKESTLHELVTSLNNLSLYVPELAPSIKRSIVNLKSNDVFNNFNLLFDPSFDEKNLEFLNLIKCFYLASYCVYQKKTDEAKDFYMAIGDYLNKLDDEFKKYRLVFYRMVVEELGNASATAVQNIPNVSAVSMFIPTQTTTTLSPAVSYRI